MKVSINGRRYSIPATPAWEGKEHWGTGITLKGVFIGPRSGRIILKTDSIWDNGQGCCVGIRYHIAEEWELAKLCLLDSSLARKIDAIHQPEDM